MILTFHINRWLNNKRFSKNKIWIHSLEEYSIPGEKLCRIISGEMYPGTHMALSNKVRRREFRKRQTFWQHEEKVQEQHSGYYKAWTEEVTTGCWCLGSTQELRLTGGGSWCRTPLWPHTQRNKDRNLFSLLTSCQHSAYSNPTGAPKSREIIGRTHISQFPGT